jgi:hypothetical protein
MRVKVHGKPLNLRAGRLSLTEEQAARRKHLLKQDGDQYVIVGPVQFKVGESFDYEGDALPKGYAEAEAPKPKAEAPKPKRGRPKKSDA